MDERYTKELIYDKVEDAWGAECGFIYKTCVKQFNLQYKLNCKLINYNNLYCCKPQCSNVYATLMNINWPIDKNGICCGALVLAVILLGW